MTAPIPIADQIAEVERELGYRDRVYPGWVLSGRMTQDRASFHVARLRAAAATLRAIQANADGLRALISYLNRARAGAATVAWNDHMPSAAETAVLLDTPGVRAVLEAFPGAAIVGITSTPPLPLPDPEPREEAAP